MTLIAWFRKSRAHEAEDKKRRELIDVKNTADGLVYQTEKALRDLGDKVPEAERSSIEGKISELKSARRRTMSTASESERGSPADLPCPEPAALCTGTTPA
jgi:molecular chaperone DnaK (HSP70)